MLYNSPTPFTPQAFPQHHHTDLNVLDGTRFALACMDLAQQHQLEPDMAALSLLGAISVAAQGRYDVKLPHGSITPLAEYTLIVAESGEGKTAVHNKTMAPLKRVQRECYAQYRKESFDYYTELTAWEATNKRLKADLLKAEKKGEGVEAVREEHRRHQADKPTPPREFRLLYPDATPTALFEGLRDIMPTGALVTDEGNTYFSGPMRRAQGYMNSLWGGEDLIVTRSTKEDIVVYGPRYGMHISIQPGVLERHLKPEDRDSGWAARFLVCAPKSVRGTRLYQLGSTADGEGWQWADQRLEGLVRENLDLLDDPDLPRQQLSFTLDAQHRWVWMANEIEQSMQPNGRFQNCPDHASKLTNHIGRVAALLHLFEDLDGDIDIETLNRAAHLCSYYSDHFQQVLMPPPQEIQDAHLLRQWFGELYRCNYVAIPYNWARQRGPSPLRNAKRLKEAVNVLMFEGIINQGKEGRTNFIYFLRV